MKNQTKFQKFINALILLTNREQEILELYYAKRRTMEELAQLFGVTTERIRQLLMKVEKIIERELK